MLSVVTVLYKRTRLGLGKWEGKVLAYWWLWCFGFHTCEHSYFGIGSLGLGGLMSLWWFARHCRIRNTAVWLAATAISGVNASVLRGLSSIIWFIIPDSSVISECSTSLADTLHKAGSIARAKRSP